MNNEKMVVEPQNVKDHRETLESLHELYKRKNIDYGNSFDKSLDEHGLIAAIVRMEDKFNRIKKLNKSTALVNDESIIDTLLDLGNYSIMAAIWYKNKETENNDVLQSKCKDKPYYCDMKHKKL